MTCPSCGSKAYKKKFLDYNGIQYQICGYCSCHFQNPPIIKEYKDSYWIGAVDPEGNVRNLTKERDFKIKNWYGDTIGYVNKLKKGRILDVGAGLGFFLSAISNDFEKHALEVSDFSIKFIKKNFPEINTIKGFLSEEIYKKESFDVIMYYHVIEHVSDPNKELIKLKKLLKKDGILIIGTPNIGSLAAKLFKKNFRLYGHGHLNLFTKKGLISLLKKHDFKIIKKEFPYFKTDYATFKNFLRLFKKNTLSPPFYGSIMTVYSRKMSDTT